MAQKTASLLFTVISLSLPVAIFGAEVYKWVDEQGRTHYGSQKPATVDKVEVLEVYDSASSTSKPPDLDREVERIRDAAQQLANEREVRERGRLEDRLNTLEDSYQQLLEEKSYARESENGTNWTYTPAYLYPPLYPQPGLVIHHREREHRQHDDRPPFRPPVHPPVTPVNPREQGVASPARATPSSASRGAAHPSSVWASGERKP